MQNQKITRVMHQNVVQYQMRSSLAPASRPQSCHAKSEEGQVDGGGSTPTMAELLPAEDEQYKSVGF